MKIKEKYILKADFKEAICLGEEGDMMTCAAKTERGAWIKFRQRMRDDVGEEEAKEIKLENVGIGWLHLMDDKDREEMGVEEDNEWFVSTTKKTLYQVWVYTF